LVGGRREAQIHKAFRIPSSDTLARCSTAASVATRHGGAHACGQSILQKAARSNRLAERPRSSDDAMSPSHLHMPKPAAPRILLLKAKKAPWCHHSALLGLLPHCPRVEAKMLSTKKTLPRGVAQASSTQHDGFLLCLIPPSLRLLANHTLHAHPLKTGATGAPAWSGRRLLHPRRLKEKLKLKE